MCDCTLCEIGRDLRAEPLNRERLRAGVDWLMEDSCERDMEFSHLVNAVAEYTKAHDAPELVEALRLIAPEHIGQQHPDYRPPPRRKIRYMPSFVESYAELSGRTLPEARAALREGSGGSFHLELAAEQEPTGGER